MTGSKALLTLQKVGQLVLLCVFCVATFATSRERPVQPMPTLSMTTTRLSDDGRNCGQELYIARGSVPAGKRAVVRLRLEGDRNVPYSFFEEALAERAKSHCAQGLAVLTAEPSSNGAGFDAVEAIAWVDGDLQVMQPPSEIADDDGAKPPPTPELPSTQPESF